MNEVFPELIFGMVGAIGTDLAQVEDALKNALAAVGYIAVPIKLSDLMRDLNAPWSEFPERDHPEYYERAMDAGNRLREKLQDASVLARLSIASIRRRRDKAGPEKGRRVAYILDSLKRSEEIDRLREIYGPSVFIISAYSPRAARVNRLASLLAERQHDNQSTAYRGKAEGLITRDENEKSPYGQGVRKAYPLADLFVRTLSVANLTASIGRFVDILFGDVWKTPTRDEQGMAFAGLASLRSASPARQVGAAITDDGGRVLGVGTNEVAKPGGGQYWEGDPGDGRDFLYEEYDTSDKMRLNLLSDVIDRLRKLGHLSNACPSNNQLLDPESKSYKELRDAQLFDTIDFIRAVHAEASAMFAAGIGARGSTMYVTTFPCHECARHIVVSGKDAHLPRMKTLEDFDFAQSPHIPASRIRALAEGGYLERAEPVLLVGEPGTGKTHLATGLAIAACRQRKRVRFTTAAALVNQLVEAQREQSLTRMLKRWASVELIVIDELGYVPLAEVAAELLFQVIAERAEKAAVIVTTNLPFSEWPQVFTNARLCKAVLDRLTDQAHIIETGAESYRFRRTLGKKRKL